MFGWLSLGRRRSSVSGGGAREPLDSGRRWRSASSSLGVAGGRSGRCAGLGGGLRGRRVRSDVARAVPKRCCSSLAYRACWCSPAAALLHSIGLVSKASASSLRAASHGALTPKRARRQKLGSSLFCPWSKSPSATDPSHRTRVHSAVMGADRKLRAHPGSQKRPPRARHPHTNLRKPPTPPRRLE